MPKLTKPSLPEPSPGENLFKFLVHQEERTERLEREKINRDVEVSGIEVFYEGIQVVDTYENKGLVAFCNYVAGEERFDAYSTGEIVPMFQACEETWS